MSLIAKPAEGTDPIEAGNHHGICVSVIDLGTQYKFNKSTPSVMFIWELPDFPILGEDGNPDPNKGFRVISREYTAVLHELSNLCIDLVSWRGRAFTPEELEGFNVKNVLGANCLVNVVHIQGKKNNRTYANVTAVAKLPKAMTAKVGTYQLLYDMDEGIMPIPEGVPDWIKKKIEASSEYIAEMGGQAPQQVKAIRVDGPPPPDPSDGQVPIDDSDDLPF